ncbi:reverse transcriptase domain-containing protein [Tanacetum coccineum]
MVEEENPKRKREVAVTEEVLVNPSFPDQLVTIGVPRRIIEHTLNVNPSLDPVCQKRRTFSTEKSGVVTNEVAEWVKAGIVHPVKYPTYISNPVLVKKGMEPGEYAYKGYHQIQMAKEDEEKTTFYTDQGTYCYTKMPFGLKNTGATYQRLVDSTFQSQIERNLEAYVDDMVTKSRAERMLLADISETFDNLRKINMKLNPKKCSFGVEEGKFLEYMVTSEGIKANLRKTKALADLQSP